MTVGDAIVHISDSVMSFLIVLGILYLVFIRS